MSAQTTTKQNTPKSYFIITYFLRRLIASLCAKIHTIISVLLVVKNKKVAFGDWISTGRLSCYSVLSSLQISDDISFIIKNTV